MAIYQRMTIRGRGGALPTYQSQQAPYVPGQGINARVSGADAEILARGYNMEAKAMEGLVKAGKNAVDVGLQAANDYAKTKATELVTQYKMGMRQSMYGKDGILTREGESAFTANADTMSRSKELRGELLKDMQGSMVADIFNSIIDPEEAEYSLKAQEYEGKQYRVFQDRTDKAAFSEAAEMAITGYADPKSFAKGTGEALWFQEQLLRRQGYTGEALERGLKESSSKIFAGGIEQALAADDLTSARRLLKQGEDTRMTSDDVAKAKKAIKVKAEALEKKAEAAQKEAAAAQFEKDVAAQSTEVLKQVNEFPDLDWEEKEAKAVQLTKGIEDPKVRAEIRKRLAADFKEQAITHKAKVTMELDELDKLIHQTGPDGSQLTISAQLGAIQSANVSEEAKRRATKGVYDRLNGEDNTALSSAGLAAWRRWRDGEGFTASPEEQRAMMLDLGLNEKDRKAASEYEGLRVEYSQARVFGLITSVYKDLKNKPDQLNRIYEAVLAQAKGSKKPLSDKELKELIWQQKGVEVYIDGAPTSVFGNPRMMTLLEGFEVTGGQMGKLRFEVPEETVKVLRKQVELLHPWSKDSSFLPKYRDELLRVTYMRMQGITPELSKETEDAIIKAQEKYNKRMGLR